MFLIFQNLLFCSEKIAVSTSDVNDIQIPQIFHDFIMHFHVKIAFIMEAQKYSVQYRSSFSPIKTRQKSFNHLKTDPYRPPQLLNLFSHDPRCI